MINGQIKVGALISYLGIIINILSGLLYTPWILKTIGVSDYGLYTLAISLISIFVMDFGVSAAVTRYSSLYLAKGEKKKSDEVVALAYKLYFIIDILITIVLFIVFFFISDIYTELTFEEIERFKTVYIIVAIYNIIQFPLTNLNGILNAYEKFIQLKIGDLVNKVFIVIVTIVVLIQGGGLYELVVIYALGGVVTIIFKWIMVKKYTDCSPILKGIENKSIQISEILGFSAWSTVISIASRCIFLVTPSILGAVSGSISIAVFGFASTLENYVFMVANALNGLFLPKISRMLLGVNREHELLSLMIKIGRIQVYIIGLIIVGFIVLGKSFILLWLGEEYEIIFSCALLIILPSYINLPQQIANTAMTVENHVKSQAMVFVAMALINITLSLLMAGEYGALGACMSIFIAYIFRIIIMNYLYNKKLNINIWIFFKKTIFVVLPWQVLTILIGIVLFNTIGLYYSEFDKFCLTGLALIIIYIYLMYRFTMNEEEKRNIYIFLRRRIVE